MLVSPKLVLKQSRVTKKFLKISKINTLSPIQKWLKSQQVQLKKDKLKEKLSRLRGIKKLKKLLMPSP